MNRIFSQVQPARLQKTAFDLSHEHKLTCDMGKCYPVLLQEVVPGDKFTINSSHMIRFSPLVSPVMHKIDAYIHYFYVPTSLIDENFEKMIVDDSDATTAPEYNLESVVIGSLADYLGLPIVELGEKDHVVINEYAFRVYQLIWDNFYRDQNFQTALSDDWDAQAWKDQLHEFTSHQTILPRAWAKDYFTSALPYAQKGEPVSATGVATGATHIYGSDGNLQSTGGTLTGTTSAHVRVGAVTDDLTLETGVETDVNEIRLANAIQRFMERIYRVGSRYIEYLLGVWGVQSDDLTLKRPQYIGGGRTPVVVSEVLNTNGRDLTGDTNALPQGNMSGHGLSVGNQNFASVYCKYHGYIMGILSIMPEPAYDMGIHKMFMRFNALDYYTPDFANLGEQEIKNLELYVSGVDHVDHATFGYQQRFAEYKYAQSSIHGQFRDELEHYHLARSFSDTPVLGDTFIECSPSKRIFALPTETNSLYVTIWHNIVAVRPMPLQPIPGLF